MRTTEGYKPIDMLYRRVDDDYLDPLNFRAESMLGVSGIMDGYRAGGITIANAPGTGIADDKAIYSYMPEIVEFYTGESPILQNVRTWRCSEPTPSVNRRAAQGLTSPRIYRTGALLITATELENGFHDSPRQLSGTLVSPGHFRMKARVIFNDR